MSGIDEVLERLVTDAQFRGLLQRDPAAALSGYVLYDEDLEVLAATLDDAGGGERNVEQRTSKSAFLYALTGLIDESGGGLAGHPGSDDGPAADAGTFGSPTDTKDLDMRDLPDPDEAVSDGSDGVSIDPEREAVAPDAVPGEDAEGPTGLRSDGELVQASDARDVPGAEGTTDGDEEDPETALPRSSWSRSDTTPGIEGSDISTGG